MYKFEVIYILSGVCIKICLNLPDPKADIRGTYLFTYSRQNINGYQIVPEEPDCHIVLI